MLSQIKTKYFLFKVADILEKNNIEFFLCCGTLLGAIRNNNFISYDNDVDIGFRKNYFFENHELWYKVIKELDKYKINPNVVWFNHASITVSHTYKQGKRIVGIPMNIYSHIKRADRYYLDLEGLQYFFPEIFMDTLDKITFLGREFHVPHKPKEYLTFMYGKNWKIPIRNFKEYNNKITRLETKEIEYKHIMPYYKEEIK